MILWLQGEALCGRGSKTHTHAPLDQAGSGVLTTGSKQTLHPHLSLALQAHLVGEVAGVGWAGRVWHSSSMEDSPESFQSVLPLPLQGSRAREVCPVLWASPELKEQWVSVPKQWVCPFWASLWL